MIHSDHKMQQLIKQLHAAIRTFGNEYVVYYVVAKLGHYEVAVIMRTRRDSTYWDNLQHNIVRAIIRKFIEQAPEVSHDDINYVPHPGLTLEAI